MNLIPQKILVIFGTRPEAIKLAPLIRELESDPAPFHTSTCVTAPHRDMLDQVLDTFQIVPDPVMQDGQDLFQVTARSLQRLNPILMHELPDWVLVQGDTTTTFVASLAAFYLGIKVGHVEAGLRTGSKSHPFPEEMNRRLTASLADIHFAPTLRARDNLVCEGISPRSIHVTGNTGIDALFYARERCSQSVVPIPGLEKWAGERPLILVTGHRRESFGTRFRQICEALQKIALRGDVDLVYPVHLNPNVQEPVRRILGDLPNVFLIEPLGYLQFIALMERSYMVMTDSGGVQEEASSLGKPVLVMREVTERLEVVEAGSAKLVGSDPDAILSETARLLEDREEYSRMSMVRNLFGDGRASTRIARILAGQATSPSA